MGQGTEQLSTGIKNGMSVRENSEFLNGKEMDIKDCEINNNTNTATM
jgi:hypothetical protein